MSPPATCTKSVKAPMPSASICAFCRQHSNLKNGSCKVNGDLRLHTRSQDSTTSNVFEANRFGNQTYYYAFGCCCNTVLLLKQEKDRTVFCLSLTL